ncbi:MAG: hypothetical protein WB795_24610, partial [Candidatus Acidiferrales bacterium]
RHYSTSASSRMLRRSGTDIIIFGNYFSAFVVPDAKHRDEVEGILIASMPTANSASPKIKRIPLPREVTRMMRGIRRRSAASDE